MHRLIKAITFAIVIGCLSITYSCQSKTAKAETLTSFLEGVIETQGNPLNLKEPIISIKELAQKQATKTIQLSKLNIKSALEEARNYKCALIIVGKHTILKITDFDDCQKSTSWAANMPYGEGYIQNDGLSKKSDYINQLIGTPDKQSRWLFLFN